jgi:DNA-binding transcriptional LysR family regulator
MLDVRRMRLLREVATRGTIAAAAEALDFTPSAVSQQIAALEREAGIALVDRGPSSVVLTDAGRTLVAHADSVLAQLADAEAELRAIGGLRSGHLRLGSFASVTELTSRALARFRAHHPGVELTVSECEARESLELLRRGELDVALVYVYDHSPLVAGRALETRDLMRDPVVVAVPRTHPLAGRDGVPLRELADERWLTEGSTSECHRLVEGAFRGLGGIPATVSMGSNDYRLAQALVAAGLGVAFIPELARQPDAGVAYVTPEEPIGRTIAVACRAGGRRSPAVATMIEILVEAAP